MSSQSSYERIEFYLHALKEERRADSTQHLGPTPVGAQHVRALLDLFEQNMRELSRSSDPTQIKR